VNVVEGEEFSVDGIAEVPIELPVGSEGPTGYKWNFQFPDGVEYIGRAPADDPAPGRAVGSVGIGPPIVTAVAGEHTIVASLELPWEAGQPIRVVRINLHVRSPAP
jgi:hypothetical protein